MQEKSKSETTPIRMRSKFVTVVYSNTTGVAARWREQYEERLSRWYDDNKKEIYKKLLALGENPDREDVAKIVGNKSWSYLTCDGCQESEAALVSIGEYEAKNYCKTCLAESNQIAKDIS